MRKMEACDERAAEGGVSEDGEGAAGLAVAAMAAAVAAAQCGSERKDRDTAEHQSAALKIAASLSGNPSQFLVGNECDGSMNQETASVVIPPDASSPYCPNGRAFVSFGGWLQQVDLNWVSSPNGHASQRTLSSIMNFPVNFPTPDHPNRGVQRDGLLRDQHRTDVCRRR